MEMSCENVSVGMSVERETFFLQCRTCYVVFSARADG